MKERPRAGRIPHRGSSTLAVSPIAAGLRLAALGYPPSPIHFPYDKNKGLRQQTDFQETENKRDNCQDILNNGVMFVLELF
jgi:hypothetical protein